MPALNNCGRVEIEPERQQQMIVLFRSCHFYDVVRLDEHTEEASSGSREHERRYASLDGYEEILCKFLPLLREHVPEAAAEIESYVKGDVSNQVSQTVFACHFICLLLQKDGYVYDLYTVGNEMDMVVEDAQDMYPMVQVKDDEFYDGQSESKYDYSDSNDEGNPRNDYPDEDEISSSENEGQHTSSDKESDGEDSNSHEEDTNDEDESCNKNYRWAFAEIL